MSDETLDPTLEAIATIARRPASLGSAARARVLLAVESEIIRHPAGRRRRFAVGTGLGWLVEPRALRLSPLAAGALAASLVGMGLAMGLVGRARALLLPPATASGAVATSDAGRPGVPAALAGLTPAGAPAVPPGARAAAVKFVFVAPQATEVAVVGSFNQWDSGAHRMQRTPTGGTWTITVPLEAGMHTYSFVVDGTQWMPDPAAPLAPEDGFGGANSVVLVSGSTS